jgi:hypothetical protein
MLCVGVKRCSNGASGVRCAKQIGAVCWACAKARKLFAAAAAACAIVFGTTQPTLSAPITFVTALPVAQDQLVWRNYFDPSYKGDDPTAANRDLWNLLYNPVFAWGPTADLAIFGSLTPQYSLLNENLAQGRVTRTAGGLGDSLLFARYTAYAKDFLGATLRIDPLAGLYFPTGWYNKSDIYGRLPQDMQGGSGSVDPYFGLTTMWKTQADEFDWDVTYRYNPAASSGYRLGNSFHTDFAYYRRVVPWILPDIGLDNQVWVGLETNLIRDGTNRVSGTIDPNTGGFVWYLDPGIFYGTPFWTAGMAVQVPVIQDLNGVGRLSGSFRFFLYFEYYFMMPSLPKWAQF